MFGRNICSLVCKMTDNECKFGRSVSLTAVKRIYFCVKRGKKVADGGTTVCFLFYFSN